MSIIDEYREEQIKQLADSIRKDFPGSKIFGEKIDLENIDHLLVAAYYLGMFRNDPYFSKTILPE